MDNFSRFLSRDQPASPNDDIDSVLTCGIHAKQRCLHESNPFYWTRLVQTTESAPCVLFPPSPSSATHLGPLIFSSHCAELERRRRYKSTPICWVKELALASRIPTIARSGHHIRFLSFLLSFVLGLERWTWNLTERRVSLDW